MRLFGIKIPGLQATVGIEMHVFWDKKNLCSSKSMQLELLNKVRARSPKNANLCISN